MFRLRLKELREFRNLSQQQLADILGISQGTVGNWESGIREPNFTTVIKIADYFNVTSDYLLGRDEDKKKSAPTTENSDVETDALKLYKSLLASGLLKEGQDLTPKQIDGLTSIAGLIAAMFND